jgi:hypothetical protein
VHQPCVNMMNADVNNGRDDPPFDVALRGMVQQYGIWRVMLGALRQARPARQPPAMALNPYLRRDVGLPPDDAG